MSRLRSILETILHISILATFFFVPWWLRPGWAWLPTPYYGGFFVSVPVLLAIGSWFVLGVPGLYESLNDDRRWWVIGIFALMIWCFLSSLWSIYPANAADSAQQFAAVGLFSLAVLCHGPSARGVCRAVAVGMLFQAGIALAQVQLQRPIGLPQLGEFTLRPYNVGLSILVSGTSRLMRPYGLTNHPNVLGGYFAFGLLSLTAWLAPAGPTRKWLRILQMAVMALALWILCLSFSRSAWLGFALGILALAWAWRGGWLPLSKRQVITVAVVGIAILVGFGVVYGKFVIARTGVTGEGTEERSISDRLVYLSLAGQIIGSHPILGIGIGVFPLAASDLLKHLPYDLPGDNVHNVPLLVLSELGMIGFVLWGATWVAGGLVILRRVRDPFALGVAAGVLALQIIGLLDHYTWSSFQIAILLWAGMAVAIAPGPVANMKEGEHGAVSAEVRASAV